MAKTGYVALTEGAVALAAATAKTVLGVKGHANFGVDMKGFWVDFDGVTASALPVLCEFGYCSWATNAPGTASTSVTVNQVYGRVTTAGFTAGKTWTTEPTTITVLDAFTLDPNKGLFRYDWSLGESPDANPTEGYILRLTAPATVNARAGFRIERA
jgi:hypothetical protein